MRAHLTPKELAVLPGAQGLAVKSTHPVACLEQGTQTQLRPLKSVECLWKSALTPPPDGTRFSPVGTRLMRMRAVRCCAGLGGFAAQWAMTASASRAKTCGSQLRPGVVFAGTCARKIWLFE